MNFIDNNREKNVSNSNISNSLIFFLYHSTKNNKSYYKNNNRIVMSYKETWFKRYLYIASNGLKKDSIFPSEYFDKIYPNLFDIQFTSYFFYIEDKFSKFDFFDQRYKKTILLKHLNTQTFILNSNLRLLKNLKNTKPLLKSKYDLIHYNLKKKFKLSGISDKMIVVRVRYRDLYLLTTRGLLFRTLDSHYSPVTILAGLFFMFKKDVKLMLKKLFRIGYLLFRFLPKTLSLLNTNIETFSNTIIYYYYYQYLKYNFYKKKKNLRIKWRKSNITLLRFLKKLEPKINKIIKLFYYLAFKKQILKFKYPDYFKNGLFNSINYFSREKILNNPSILFSVTYILKLILIKLINLPKFSWNYNNRDYFLLKITFIKEYILKKLKNSPVFFVRKIDRYYNFNLKNIESYIRDFSILKTINKISCFYPPYKSLLLSRRLIWLEPFEKTNVTYGIFVKIDFKRLYNYNYLKTRFWKSIKDKIISSSSLINSFNFVSLRLYKLYNSIGYLKSFTARKLNYLFKERIKKQFIEYFTKRKNERKQSFILFFRKIRKLNRYRYHWKYKRRRSWKKFLIRSLYINNLWKSFKQRNRHWFNFLYIWKNKKRSSVFKKFLKNWKFKKQKFKKQKFKKRNKSKYKLC